VGGRPILPGAAMFEAAAAATSTLQQDDSRTRQRVALRGLTIAAPLPLDVRNPASGSAALLECTVHPAAGTLELTSRPAAGGRPQTHCRSSVAAISADSPDVLRSAQPQRASAAARALNRQWSAGCSGSVSASLAVAASGASGYFLHPAAMDSTLHLSAAAAAAGAAAAQVTRVPTGLSCLVLAQAPVAGNLHPLAIPEAATPTRPDGSMRCSFKLAATAPGEASPFELGDLTVKEMPAAQPAAGAAAAAQPQQAPAGAGVVYEVQWQAANSGTSSQPALGPAGGHSWHATASGSLLSGSSAARQQAALASKSALHADFSAASGSAAPSAAQATLQGLELLQRRSAASPASSSLRLTTRGAFQPLLAAGRQQGGATAVAGAALAALAKVAANEFPGAGISGLDVGSSTPPAVLLSGSTKVRFCSYGPLQLRMASSIRTTAPWHITAHPFPACYSTASAHSDADNGSHCVHRVPGRLGRRQPAAPATWRAYCAAPLPASPAARGCCPAPAARWRTSDSCRWHSRSRDPERSRWASLIRVTVRIGS